MSQADRLLKELQDGQPHSSIELVKAVYDSTGPSIARLGARIWDLRSKGHPIKSWKDPERHTIQWYQLERKMMDGTEDLIRKYFC